MLQAQDCWKSYGSTTAVAGVSLEVNRGEIVGLLGPNGAGKSTLVGMICGLMPADRGGVLLDGQPVGGEASQAKRRIGLVPQDIALHEQLPARDNVRLFGALYGLHGSALRDRVDAALARVGLAERAADKPATFSGGMKRRLNIACALVHDPELLVLDEPTVGIDPQSRNAIFDWLEALRAEGKGLLYTSHYMEEVERLCDRIVVVDHGRVVAAGTRQELAALLPRGRKHVVLDGEVDDELLAQLAARGLSVRVEDATSLEEVFLHLTGRQLRD